MSIVAYTGLPGSGKSYGVVENVIIPALQTGRTIVTNLAIKTGTLIDDYPVGKIHIFTDDDVSSEFWSLEKYPGAIWVIDEAHHYWPSGLKMNNVPSTEKAFFTEHRHSVGSDGMTTEIVIVTQDLGQCASFLRNLVEDTYRASKLSALGMSKKYRVDVYQGGVSGPKPRGHYRQLFGTYKSDVFKYYRSHTKNKTDFASGMEEKTDDRANAFKNPLIKYGLPLGLLLIIYSAFKVYQYLSIDSKPTDIPASELPVNQSLPDVKQAVKVTLTQTVDYAKYELDIQNIQLSDEWRIVGLINNLYLIDSQIRGSRFISKRQCRTYHKTGEPYCVISGKLVTWYSAEIPEQPEIDRSYTTDIQESVL